MSEHPPNAIPTVEVERADGAVWALPRDCRVARPRLRSEHFSDYGVQERGEGAGTVIAYRLRVGRHQRDHVVWVKEPMPGRMLSIPGNGQPQRLRVSGSWALDDVVRVMTAALEGGRRPHMAGRESRSRSAAAMPTTPVVRRADRPKRGAS